MSEFSDSLHLRSDEPADGVALLRAAKVAGYVFPAANGWVPITYSTGSRVGDSENLERITSANRKLLVHYSYAEDHGCYVDAYEGPNRVGRIKAAFESDDARFDRDAFVRLGLLTPPGAVAVEGWVAKAHEYAERHGQDEYLVARALSLPRFEWFAYRYELDNDAPDTARIEVDSEGHVRTVADTERADIEELLNTLPPTRKPTRAEAAPVTPKKTKAKPRAKAAPKSKPKAKPKPKPKPKAKAAPKKAAPRKKPRAVKPTKKKTSKR